jgi:hypothetical protein
MKAVILPGGPGMRIAEESVVQTQALAETGGKPGGPVSWILEQLLV